MWRHRRTSGFTATGKGGCFEQQWDPKKRIQETPRKGKSNDRPGVVETSKTKGKNGSSHQCSVKAQTHFRGV